MSESIFSFKLPENFVQEYSNKSVDWQYKDAAGNSVAEITFLRTYSRLKPDGTKERWWEVCERVINGMFSLQKDHCKRNKLPWNDRKAQSTAQDAYDRLFNFKWTPPGRGLWMMGTPLVNEKHNSAALQNCSFVSTADMTKYDPAGPFCFLMEASMLGVGVGFDTKGAEKDFYIYRPSINKNSIYTIDDSREGWVESVKLVIEAYLLPNRSVPTFDYSQIRLANTPIATFGGVAAGSEPLFKLHNSLVKVFDEKIGQKLDTRLIADIGNLIGVCVVSGNVRRSAELLIGNIQDDDFLNLKNYGQTVDGEWIPGPGSERSEWAWMSNNSVSVNVDDDLDRIVEGVQQNGEPGVIWLDVSREYGRLVDPPNNKDWRLAGYNPSLVPGTKVYTTDGILPIEQLDGKDFKVKNLDGSISAAYCWQSGHNKQTYDVNLSGGWSYGATKEHKWPVWNDISGQWEKKTTLEIKPGDKLPNLVQNSMFPEGIEGTYEEGFLIGWNLGDGWQTDRKDGRRQYGFMVGPKDRESGIDKKLESIGYGINFNEKDEINLSNSDLHQLFVKFEVQHKTKGLPLSVWNSNVSDDFRRGLVDALFSADASVEKSGRISFSQASEKMINDVASLLGFFGIKSSKTNLTLDGSVAFPDKYKIGEKSFVRYTLRIGSLSNLANFVALFSITSEHKNIAIKNALSRAIRRVDDNTWFIEVKSVTEGIKSDVWDITVYDDTHAFQLDHCITGNCAEQGLESYECCTLVETYLNHHENLEDFKKTLKIAYLYGKTVTLLPTHWPKTNAIMQRNRRIGTSISGIANFADTNGIPKLTKWMDEGYNEIQRLDHIYSEWLCVRESIKTTTVKPSGTVSILAGESPGVHWTPGGSVFNRTIRFGKNDPMVPLFINSGYRVEDALESPETTVVVYFPIKSTAKRSERDVSLFEKATLAVTAQRWWSDNSVSVTLTFDPETESNYVKSVLDMYRGQFKTVSFLPLIAEGAYKQMPYSRITEEEYKIQEATLWPINFDSIYENGTSEAEGEKGCTTDRCLMPVN